MSKITLFKPWHLGKFLHGQVVSKPAKSGKKWQTIWNHEISRRNKLTFRVKEFYTDPTIYKSEL
jgi:hypothetical protein